jgi:hypothetical protein
MSSIKTAKKPKQKANTIYVFRAHYVNPNDLARTTYCLPQVGLSVVSEQDLDEAINYFYGNVQDELGVAFEGPGLHQYLSSVSVHLLEGDLSSSDAAETFVKEYFF